MTDTSSTLIPLNKLTAWDGNVRRQPEQTPLSPNWRQASPRTASCKSLVVRRERAAPCRRRRSRRLGALQLLSEQGKIAEDKLIECNVIADDADATEISLVENTSARYAPRR